MSRRYRLTAADGYGREPIEIELDDPTSIEGARSALLERARADLASDPALVARPRLVDFERWSFARAVVIARAGRPQVSYRIEAEPEIAPSPVERWHVPMEQAACGCRYRVITSSPLAFSVRVGCDDGRAQRFDRAYLRRHLGLEQG